MYRSAVVGALHPFVWSFGSLDLNQKYKYIGTVCISPVVAHPPQF